MTNLISIDYLVKEFNLNKEKIIKILKTRNIEIFYIEGEEFIKETDSLDEFMRLELSSDADFSQSTDKTEDGSKPGKYDKRNKLNDLTGKEWMPETKSFWYQKGLGRNHPHAKIERQHPAPFSFQDIARLINFFTKSGEFVLDPFSGVGSTLKAAALNGRKGIGIELSEHWANLSIERLEFEVHKGASEEHDIIVGDSREELKKLADNSIDFAVTSPPYWAILNKKPDHKVLKERVENDLATNYSNSDKDLGNVESYTDFLDILTDEIFYEVGNVLKEKKYLAIVVSDFRHKSEFISFHSDLIEKFKDLKLRDGFVFSLQGVKVLLQNHKSLLPYGYPFAYVENIHHQYILIFRKVKE